MGTGTEKTAVSEAEERPHLGPGDVVEHFKVIRRVGIGGMGEIYLARDTRLGRKVALKVISAQAIGDEKAVERFLFEARVTARFSHPSIVTIHSVGEHQGHPFVALEFLNGQNIRERMVEERPSVSEVMRVVLAVAGALSAAHEEGIIHRDLKPENIFISSDGRLKVLDFGLAKAVERPRRDPKEGAERRESLAELEDMFETKDGVLVGTPHYMAPEQWLGEPCTAATDVWQLGVVLYELLSGTLPFLAPTPVALFREICTEPTPELNETAYESQDVHEELTSVVGRCLEKGPESRPTAGEVAESMRQILEGPSRMPSAEASPYRGLLPFTEQHADSFFGRDAEIEAFLERLRSEPVLPIVGPSGAGKSSFVRAGVIPRLLERGRWKMVKLRPGSRPLEHLSSRLRSFGLSSTSNEGEAFAPTLARGSGQRRAADSVKASRGDGNSEPEPSILSEHLLDTPSLLALNLQQLAEREGSKVLLFVDQLEELFTMVHDRTVRESFMRALCGAADDAEGPVRVIFTIRDDFLGRVAETEVARQALSRITVLRSPEPEALAETLTRPLERLGYAFESPSLPQEMVATVRSEPASLPLLQFAASMLWERRDERKKTLTRAVYEAIGGVEGALANHADEVLCGLGSEQVELARQILLRLITPEQTRRVAERTALLEGLGQGAGDVLDRMIEGRMVVVRKGRGEEGELELVHESLISRWQRLSRWLEESREEVTFLAEVGRAAALWDQRGRKDSEVWSGTALQEGLIRAARCEVVPRLVEEFLAAGRRRKSRSQRVAFGLAIGVIAALVIIAGLLFVSYRNADRAREQEHRERQLAMERRAEAQLEGARAALLSGDLLEARAKIRSSLEVSDSTLARAIWWRLKRTRKLWKRQLCGFIYDVDLSPSGDALAAACIDGTARLLDRKTLAMKVLRGHEGQVLSVEFSPDGERLATTGMDGDVRLWSREGQLSKVFHGHANWVTATAFSPDGELLASAGNDKTVRLWDISTGKVKRQLLGHDNHVNAIAFGSDGHRLVSGGRGRELKVWDVRTGESRDLELEGEDDISDVALSPNGQLAAVSTAEHVAILEVETGETKVSLTGRLARVAAIDFGPDNRLVVTGSSDEAVRVWDVSTGREKIELGDHGAPVQDVSFGPDGLVASGDESGRVHLWDINREGYDELDDESVMPPFGLATFSPDGRHIASGWFGHTVVVRDVETGRVLKMLRNEQPVEVIRFSPAGSLLAASATDGTVRIWELQTGARRALLRGHERVVVGLAFSPDGEVLATGSWDHSIRLWDTSTGMLIRELGRHDSFVNAVAFSPDGNLLASGSRDKTLRIWDLVEGNAPKILEGHAAEVKGLAFSPDGTLLASGAFDKTARIWDLDTHEDRIVGRHEGGIIFLDFHPDGRHLATPSIDGTVKLWDIETGTQELLDRVPGGAVSVDLSPGGALAVISSVVPMAERLIDVTSRRPAWRASALIAQPVQLLRHDGWISLEPGGDRAAESDTAWRREVESSARVATTTVSGDTLCLATWEDELQLWDIDADQRLLTRSFKAIKQIISLPSSCLVLDGRRLLHVDENGSVKGLLNEGVEAMAHSSEQILAVASGKLHVLDGEGRELELHDVAPGITALVRAGGGVVGGFQEGSIEVLVEGPETSGRVTFEDVPASAVVRMIEGPMRTVIAGYVEGLVGMWDLEKGDRLLSIRLHGPIQDLLLDGQRLYAVSERGDFEVVDLSVFYRAHEELLYEVRETIPVVWEGGKVISR